MQSCFNTDTTQQYDDIFELCGGSAKVSVIMIRRRYYNVGPNFDAVVGIGLTNPHHVQELWRYIRA
eukprot:12741545-Prorocentrum_lima.AAC.1